MQSEMHCKVNKFIQDLQTLEMATKTQKNHFLTAEIAENVQKQRFKTEKHGF